MTQDESSSRPAQHAAPGKTVRIGAVDPIAFSEQASAILKEAWRPPAIDYTPEYIRFQCGFPTTLPAVGVAGWQAEEPVAFVAAAGRQSTVGELYLSSFLGLRPGVVSSLPVAIIRTEIRATRAAGMPILVFAQVGSTGEQLLNTTESMGLTRYLIGEYRVHSGLPRALPPTGVEVQELPPQDWAYYADTFADPAVLSPVFNAANLSHFAADPYGRRFLAVRQDGEVVAVAMQAWTQMVTGSGILRTPTLHYVRLSRQEPEPIMALLAAASASGSAVVTIPNTIGITPPVAKAAGVRATGAAFAAYVVCPNGCQIPDLRGTDFEIV